VPYYEQQILPLLIEGKNVLVCAHGNSIRALIKYLDKIADEDIASLEIGTGEVYIFDIDKKGLVISKEIRSVNPNTGKI
jgi:2,3-bisphosphoglycerate-dependent phosphoglycerate mutase